MLVIEELSIMICATKNKGRLRCIKITFVKYLTQFLFADDVVIFGKGTIEEWHTFSDIITLFCVSIGMEVSTNKSSFLKNVVDECTFFQIATLFPFKSDEMECGFKYLG